MSTRFASRFKREFHSCIAQRYQVEYLELSNKYVWKEHPQKMDFCFNNISEEYDDFVDNKDEQLKVYVRKMEFAGVTKSDYLKLAIQYKVFTNDIINLLCTNRINNLPIALNNHILDYICEPVPGWTRSVWTGLRFVPVPHPYIYKNIDIKVEYPSDYPFRSPIYSLVDIETNASNKLYIKNFIENKILQYNKCWNFHSSENWSPAYSIRKDIFCFMVSLEGFKNMINKF